MDETPRSSRSRLRAAVVIIAIATAIIALVAAAVAGDGSEDETAATTTTMPNAPEFPPGGEEFVLRPGAPDLRVRLGDRITFAMGDPGDGE